MQTASTTYRNIKEICELDEAALVRRTGPLKNHLFIAGRKGSAAAMRERHSEMAGKRASGTDVFASGFWPYKRTGISALNLTDINGDC